MSNSNFQCMHNIDGQQNCEFRILFSRSTATCPSFIIALLRINSHRLKIQIAIRRIQNALTRRLRPLPPVRHLETRAHRHYSKTPQRLGRNHGRRAGWRSRLHHPRRNVLLNLNHQGAKTPRFERVVSLGSSKKKWSKVGLTSPLVGTRCGASLPCYFILSKFCWRIWWASKSLVFSRNLALMIFSRSCLEGRSTW